jgi:hypothetical protein
MLDLQRSESESSSRERERERERESQLAGAVRIERGEKTLVDFRRSWF